jgi:hypothetical protein
VTSLWKWLAAALAGAGLALLALLGIRRREAYQKGDAARALARAQVAAKESQRLAEEAASAVVAAVDAEAERKIEEASHGGAVALRDRIAGRR